MKKQVFKRILPVVLAVAMVLGEVPLTAMATESSVSANTSSRTAVSVPEGRVYITSKQYNLVPGATETVLTTNNSAGTDQKIGFIMKFDADALKDGSIKAVATYKDYEYDGKNFGMQTVTDQAKAYEKKTDEKVIAGINASFYNLNTGEPAGAFVMNGVVHKEANERAWFAMLDDGTAMIGTGELPDNALDAVAGDVQIVTDGKVTVPEGDYQSLNYSRCAIGITAAGDVITYTTHGVSAPTSCGETYVDVAENLIAQGCVQAVNLDGGGSATSCSVREGEDALTVKNSPSDGTPRTVSTAIVFVSTKQADGVFHHAALEPNNEYYTPSTAGLLDLFNKNETTVQFTATGIDGSGTECELPEGLTWAVDESCKDMGTIDAATGLFTAEVDALGTVTVNLLDGTEVVGTTNIVLAEPEEIAFSGTGVSLDFSETTDFGLTVKGQGVELNHKDGDFTWTMDNEDLGTMEGNIFTAAPKQDTSIEGNITATYKKADGIELSKTIFVEVGKMPIVAKDYEDITGPREKEVVGSWDWGAAASNFNDGSPDQVYEFKEYDILYYLQSTTYSSDSKWISEIYETEQPWTENEDGTTVTLTFQGKEYTGTKESTYGEHGQKWVSFTDDTGAGYYWRGYIDGDTWTGNYNAGGGSASAMLGADGYMMYAWHNKANLTPVSSGTYKGIGSQIVDASEGEVRFGEHALKLTYDFENFNPTGDAKNTSIYYRLTEPIVASGSPTGFGMWVYAPEGMDNFWLWGDVSYWNGSKWVEATTLHYKPAGAEKTCQFTGINWTGWTYVELDLSPIYEAGAVVDEEHPIQFRSGAAPIKVTYIPGGSSDGEGHSIVMGSKTKGHFYVDNMRWVYGTNVDDMDSPEIVATKANETNLSAEETVTIETNDVAFTVDFMDPQGENYSGIDTTATQLFLDGSPLSASDFTATADKAQTVVKKLANGEHSLLVSICDNFGNRTEKKYNFVIANPDSDIPSVLIDREKKAELGSDYVITIKTDDISNIASVITNITYDNITKFDTSTSLGSGFFDDYGNLLTQGSDGLYYDPNGVVVEEPLRGPLSVYVSNAVQELGENLTGKLRNKATQTTRTFTATATVKDEVTSDNTLLTFTFPVPSDMKDGDKVPYSVTVTYTTKDGASYTVTTGDVNAKVYAYYTVEPGIQVSGAEAGVLNITTADGETVAADTVKVYDGTTEVEGTFTDNTFSTAYFVGQDAGYTTKNVVVADAANKHYSYATQVSVSEAAAAKDEVLHYDISLHATSKDSTTSQEITWLSAYAAGKDVVAQYVTKAAYDAVAEGTDPFADAKSAEGTSELRNFATEGKAARVNSVEITGLTAGTTYVFRVGDGTNWSEVGEFSTHNDDGSTKFMVMSDVQLGSSMTDEEKAYFEGIGSATTDVDFGLQTGDFTDNPDSFVEWDNILQTWSDVFAGKDFVRVIGNHEIYGTGAGNSKAILGMDDSQPDYYSVEYGEVYVAVINQTADLNEAAEWLIKDAAKTDCTWKVLSSHQPIYFSNPGGSNDGHHKVLKVACDAAGIDFTFSGHDHSYVRTKQQKDGVALDYATDETTNAYVDADGNYVATKGEGTVYYIGGDLGEKSRESGYKIVNNPAFNFAVARQDYDAIYITAEADENKITLNTWNLDSEGNTTVLDTFTEYTPAGICALEGEHVITHDEAVYNEETGKLVCERCEAEISPADISYTGYATSVNGADEYGDSQYYFFTGTVKTGFFPIGEDIWYANEDGLIDHATENALTNTCTENGNRTAYSPRYEESYVGGKVPFTGHFYEEQEDGSLVCSVCEHVAIDIADWNISLAFTSTNYDGKQKTPAVTIKNPETGETLEFATDGMGRLTDYTRVWNNNKEVGIATVTVAANPEGDYTNSKGDVVLTLKINPVHPKNVTEDAEAATSTSVKLTWTAEKAATGYVIYKKNAAGKWAKVGTTTETSYEVTGLNSNTEYEFSVRSYTEVEYDGETVVLESLNHAAKATAATTAGVDISGAEVTLKFTNTTYSGNAKAPAVTVVLNGVTLVQGTDFKVTRTNNVNAGTATTTVTGIGEYQGEKSVEFTINPQNLADGSVKAADTVYAGEDTTTTVEVKDKNGNVLTEDVDYTLTFVDYTVVGTATVVVTGIGNYTGSLTANFAVKAKDISGMTATVDSSEEFVYTGSEIAPAISIGNLVKDSDYTVEYKNNVDAGTATAVITAKGNYTGTVSVTFEIEARDIKDATVTDKVAYIYTGEEIEAQLNVVASNGMELEKDKDYKVVKHENNVEVGTAKVVIEGIGNYKGTVEHEFEILNKKAFTFTVEDAEFVYDGTEKEAAVKVVDKDNNVLVEGTDYTVEYADNVNAGTATVTVTGTGDYIGTLSATYEIAKADQTLTASLSATSVAIGKTVKVNATVTKGDGAVTYSVDDTTIASVSEKGVVTGHTLGKAIVTVSVSETDNYNAASKTLKLTVKLGAPTITLSNVASTGKVKITWNAVEGAAKYQVYRSTAKDGTYSRLGTTTELSWENKNAVAGKKYYYKVRALNADGTAKSAYSSVKYRTGDLPQPTISVDNVASTGKIRLTWEAVDGAVKYQVYRSETKNGTYKRIYTTEATRFINTSVPAGKAYYYKVRAVCSNTDGNSALSARKYRTCDLARPVVKSTTTTGKIKLTWAAVDGAGKYKVYRATSKNGTYKLIKTTTNVSFTNTGLTSGKTYYYKVKAINTNNSSANSSFSVITYKKVK